jgi:hypothetical protein
MSLTRSAVRRGLFALADLNHDLELEGTDREVTPENLDDRVGFLKDYYRRKVEISHEGRPLILEFTTHGVKGRREPYAYLSFDLGGLDAVPDTLTFEYSVLLDENPEHRGFLLVEHNWATGTFANEADFSRVFRPEVRRQDFDITASGRLRGFVTLVRLGAEHMLKGVDHVFFLLALLLPSVLRREGRAWQPLDSLHPALGNVVVIVTAFVAAHALALTLAAPGLLRLPEALVETMIAASTTLAAAHILFPVFRGKAWWIVFGLSFFHGLGFASGLRALGAVEDHAVLAVLGFTLGLELGQLLVVAVVFPVLFLLRRWKVYRAVLLPVAAVGMILVSGVWVIERAFGVDVPMREQLPRSWQKVLP